MQVLSSQIPTETMESHEYNQLIQNNIPKDPYQQKPIHEFVNSTLDALNQTLQQVINKSEIEKIAESHGQGRSFEDEWNILYFMRILFYILVALKLLEFIFSKKRKMDIKERVYRKYVFSHAEMIREFNEDDRKNMETTLKNTIKNASIDKTPNKLFKKNSTKKVNFHETKNEYFEHKREQQGNQGPSPLQLFLSRPVSPEPPVKLGEMMRREEEDQPQEQEFQIIETIKQVAQIKREQDNIVFSQTVEKQTCSTITQSTQEASQIKQQLSQITDQSQAQQNLKVQ